MFEAGFLIVNFNEGGEIFDDVDDDIDDDDDDVIFSGLQGAVLSEVGIFFGLAST